MKKLTVAERRERELRFAAERYSIPYDKLKHLMNRFYRLNGALERLSYLENDARTCNRRSTKELSESIDRRSDRLNADLENMGCVWIILGILQQFVKRELQEQR